MFFELNFKTGIPAYAQIVEQVKRALATGVLKPGDQLPSIRALAEQLRINRNTVARAYGDLEHEGIVQTEQGRGVFCAEKGTALTAATRRRIVAEALDSAIVQAYHLRIDDDELRALLQARLTDFKQRLNPTEDEP